MPDGNRIPPPDGNPAPRSGGTPALRRGGGGAAAPWPGGSAIPQFSGSGSPHTARSHPDRARQFMPFAALKGYYELVRDQERIEQERHRLTEEEAMALSKTLPGLSRGQMVRITYYDRDAYVTIHGAITRIDEAFRTLRVVMTDIPFDDIWRIEADPPREANPG